MDNRSTEAVDHGHLDFLTKGLSGNLTEFCYFCPTPHHNCQLLQKHCQPIEILLLSLPLLIKCRL